MRRRGLFVTGTDTGVGKTRVAVALIHVLRAQGLRVAAMKPVAAGCAPDALNEDVSALLHAANVPAPLRDVNPYSFEPGIAPHIAAGLAGVTIDLDVIAGAYGRLAAAADVVVVEGAGGWRVPLNDSEDMATLAQRLGLSVVLVVGLRLGCVNHALLSAASIAAAEVPWGGWIANRIDPAMPCETENLAALQARLPGPFLGVQPFLTGPTAAQGVPQWLTLPTISILE